MPRRMLAKRNRALHAGAVVALLLAAGALLLHHGLPGWSRGGLGRLPHGLTPQDLDFLLVTLDTTRADRIGCYGYRDIATPRLDALARGGALFEQAHASVPLTLPSHSSIFTAKYPPAHGVRDNGGYFLAESEETLAEVLQGAGFVTGGFVSAYVLDHRWGIAQGFDRYFDDFDLLKANKVSMGDIQRRGDETLEKSLEWLREQHAQRPRRRIFTWVHLYDPHSPYEPPEPYAAAYAERPYAGEIAYADSLIGQILDGLSGMGLLDRTLVVVTADHGESLGEHNESGHAFFVYGVSTHVPLILSGPYPGSAGRRIPQVVRTIDIMPTALELLGIPQEIPGEGRSLVPLLEGRSLPEPLVAYSESYYPRNHFGWSDLRALRTDQYRFIEAPIPELYESATDAEEIENLAGSLPLVVERMRELLARIEEEMGEAPQAAQPSEMDEETQRKLAALGYIGSTVDTSGKRSADLPDPKNKIQIVNRMHEAREELLKGNAKASIQKLKEVIADAPEVIDAYFRLGNAYLDQRDFPAALEMFRRTLSLKPDHDGAVVSMANTYVEMGQIQEAILGYRRFLERDPLNDYIAYRLAEALLDAGRLNDAQRMFERVLEIQPKRAAAAVGLAAVALRREDPARARSEARRALDIDPNVRHAHHNVALAYEAEGEMHEAAAAYRQEIQAHPHAVKARFNLARLLASAGDRKGQVQELKAAVEGNPDFALGRFYLAKALLDSGELKDAERQALKALELDPDNYYAPLGHYVLADVYSREGRRTEAEEAARRGRRLEARDLPPPPS